MRVGITTISISISTSTSTSISTSTIYISISISVSRSSFLSLFRSFSLRKTLANSKKENAAAMATSEGFDTNAYDAKMEQMWVNLYPLSSPPFNFLCPTDLWKAEVSPPSCYLLVFRLWLPWYILAPSVSKLLFLWKYVCLFCLTPVLCVGGDGLI